MSEDKIYSFIGLAKKAGAILGGEGLSEQAVKRGKAYLVLITEDASLNTRKKIETALYNSSIPLVEFGNKEKLGQMLGKTFFSVISVTNRGFAERIKEMVEQNKNNDNTAHGGGFFEQTKNS
ncbi:MAG: L7Ae/L30e/S12e/Gadd45 family ribosomal protein [Acetivibrionales bacterium]|mgnify:CR=1 FL=1|jgi:ribosomal protein L7Ae-like RNA K-turn-binding protein